jgi:hypothetical protein
MLCLGVIVAPWPMGSVHWPVALALCVVMCVAAGCIVWARVRQAKSVRLSVLSMTWALGAVWSALQITPWPGFLVRVLSPGRWGAHQVALKHGVAVESFWLIPSLDPGATADMTLRFLVLFAATWAVENLSMRWRQGRVLPTVLGVSVLLALGLGVAQSMLSPELFLGFYEAERAPLLGSTFVNGNQASALSAVGVWVWLVLASARGVKRQRYRAAYALCALACLGGVALQESLGVWLALSVSAGCAGAYYGLVRRGGMQTLRSRAVVIGGLVACWMCAWALAISQIERVRGSFEARAEMARAALSSSVSYPVLGSGAWSAERALGPVLDWGVVGLTRIETIEAEVVEWVLTLGWPVALLMWCGLVVSWAGPLGPAQMRARRGAAAFGMGLLVIMMGQMHFPFFMLGLGLPLVVAWASLRERALVKRTRRESDRETPVPPTRSRFGWLVTGSRLSARKVVGLCVVCGVAGGLGVYRLAWQPGRLFNTDIKALDMAQARHMGNVLPTEPQLYVRLAASSEFQDDLEGQQGLYRVAYELEPTPPYEMLWARALWRAGEHAQAQEVFSRNLQLQGYRAYKRGLAVMLETVSGGDDRAAIVEAGGPVLWTRTWKLIDKVEGEIQAQDFLQAMTDRRGDDVAAHELLVDFYIVKKRWELLNMYAQLLMMWRFEDVERGQELMWRARLRVLEAKRDPGARERLVVAQIEHFSQSERLAPHVIGMTPRLLAREDIDELMPPLQRAHEKVCRGEQGLLRHRDICEIHRAWMHEHRGELERAEELWRQRARRLGSWDVLGEYYERHALCTSIRLLVKQVSQGMIHEGKTRDEAFNARLLKVLEARHTRCIKVE